MPTCRWCQTTTKTLKLDSQGVCESCRHAARYPSRPKRHGWVKAADYDYQGTYNGGTRTFPYGEEYRDSED